MNNSALYQKVISAEIKILRKRLRGKSGHGVAWETAFIEGMAHARHLIKKVRRNLNT